MNLYLRYFDDETLVGSLDEALEFLKGIPVIQLTDNLVSDIARFIDASTSYPRRFKVGPHSHFIMIKTNARSLEEFKENNSKEEGGPVPTETGKDALTRILNEERRGWYKASLSFKRVIPSTENVGKFQYVNTDFEVKLRASSVQDCYDRVIDHLRTRADIDPRSQYPSIKGHNFHAEFLGA